MLIFFVSVRCALTHCIYVGKLLFAFDLMLICMLWLTCTKLPHNIVYFLLKIFSKNTDRIPNIPIVRIVWQNNHRFDTSNSKMYSKFDLPTFSISTYPQIGNYLNASYIFLKCSIETFDALKSRALSLDGI